MRVLAKREQEVLSLVGADLTSRQIGGENLRPHGRAHRSHT
ncbi:MAG: hypothetical protein U0361_20510 [Nitrospiraceae bacterium]